MGTRVTTGFGHDAILGVADKVIEAVKAGAVKHIFLVGGCDGAQPGRSYFTDFVKAAPADSLILTLACGKYRFNDLGLGDHRRAAAPAGHGAVQRRLRRARGGHGAGRRVWLRG